MNKGTAKYSFGFEQTCLPSSSLLTVPVLILKKRGWLLVCLATSVKLNFITFFTEKQTRNMYNQCFSSFETMFTTNHFGCNITILG